jgi:RNA polymerase sigma-70 factor, ECF subfamily
VLAAVRAGDQAAFAGLAEHYRRQLHVHCYRMLGSFEGAEDLVQETLLRAWRGRCGFGGRSLFRTWLYRIANNARLNAVQRSPRRVLVADVPPRDPGAELPVDERPDLGAPPAELPWLQPYPDHLPRSPRATPSRMPWSSRARRSSWRTWPPSSTCRPGSGPSCCCATRWAGPRSRPPACWRSAWPRPTARCSVPGPRCGRACLHGGWTGRWRPARPTRNGWCCSGFMDAHDRADVAAFAALLRRDARQTMPPNLQWYDGREAMTTLFARYIDPAAPNYPGHMRCVPTAANRQPAAALYLRGPGDSHYWLFGLDVLEIQEGQVRGITSFGVDLLRAFGLPSTL